ncbi:bifunctional diaminohydroxyphosphoribosylaminopyrimidine deaminase/5-amino-6-(5-phosphoribosylamino)uracil reductase RibD [Hyphobacterium marinum]|uniref:diaminohydroxyphosphoribosylaminopyrimidine deaminase n=1 Tax=Hyphobacterium marinum TaxID=3116574 RepID=A0ABU7LY62_9PROT|nr:bifunctional diaminohydroxyphosphoribosylaminopyrimidine deaminase/5-amino-6-(5-phosphoribosylamino)uracil reductase RibD [Hyphobacterium sp. Y6023]MEE2566494.1 bifunctional diaminohydroxyphosphoribosylaminopyrimidine deaminase/5-amino-6-(5-phosphoribosylamino)uracil reductase RibD [Hyphobacterium sp. Y6023]
MDAALALAEAGLGTTAPNPSVGCVLVRDERVVGFGATAPGGRPHAEAIALSMAGGEAEGATAYVTLEPCAHTGQTPPCVEALIAAGVARVVVACTDPFPQVAGKGIARLEAAGIAVETGLRQHEAETLNRGFFKRLETGLPYVGIDPEPRRYDADLPARLDGDPHTVLLGLGRDGLTRVRAQPDSAAARALREAGLADYDADSVTTGR